MSRMIARFLASATGTICRTRKMWGRSRFGEEEYKKFSLGGINCKMPIIYILKKPSKSGSQNF